MDYLLKASAVLLIFYLSYQLFLQRDTFFQANRWFLLSGLILASSIPLVVIPVYIEYIPIQTSGFVSVTGNSVESAQSAIQAQPFDYVQLIIWTYLGGILVFFGKLCIEFLSLRKILKTSNSVTSDDFKILKTTENVAPFSFFNRIVYNPKQFKDEELTHVINHEKVHTKEWHSVDTIIAQLACILFWFNPIVWLYKKALQQNLEFIADQKAQYVSPCEKSYQTVLLKASVKNHQLAFTNNFYTSLIKKRIVMLHKSKSNKLNQIKFAVVLPLLALFMLSFNTKDVYVEVLSEEHIDPITLEVPQTGDIEIVISKDTTDDQLKEIQEKLKSKGISFTYKNVKRNSKGEITSIKTDFKSDSHSSNYNIKGDDGIKAFRFNSSDDSFGVGTIDKGENTFIYKANGKKIKTQSTGGNVYTVKDLHEETKGSNIKVIRDQIVDTFYVKTRKNINASENVNIFISESDEPLFVIDGKIVKKSLFEDIDSDEIRSVNILKGKIAIETYGDQGKNGVVIMSKKGSNNFLIKTDKKNNINYEYKYNIKGEEPLFIINGKTVSQSEFRGLEPNNIMSIDVIKDKRAKKVYGEKGKNGVIVIRSKTGSTIFEQSKPRVIEVREDGPWVVSSTFITDDYENDVTGEFIITKNATDAFLEQQKNKLKVFGIDAKFKKVRRNKAGEITSIKISLDDNEGRKSSATWKEKEQTIPDIVMGKSKDDKLFVRTMGHY
ncbi:MAG: M56 family metallopeptidase [Psychroserpens sp.]|uniref:M56 family metallopeptidase n=1 Tax=Psychroserpens sp. TaxID=2020870 RepID=UPI003001B2E6